MACTIINMGPDSGDRTAAWLADRLREVNREFGLVMTPGALSFGRGVPSQWYDRSRAELFDITPVLDENYGRVKIDLVDGVSPFALLAALRVAEMNGLVSADDEVRLINGGSRLVFLKLADQPEASVAA